MGNEFVRYFLLLGEDWEGDVKWDTDPREESPEQRKVLSPLQVGSGRRALARAESFRAS